MLESSKRSVPCSMETSGWPPFPRERLRTIRLPKTQLGLNPFRKEGSLSKLWLLSEWRTCLFSTSATSRFSCSKRKWRTKCSSRNSRQVSGSTARSLGCRGEHLSGEFAVSRKTALLFFLKPLWWERLWWQQTRWSCSDSEHSKLITSTRPFCIGRQRRTLPFAGDARRLLFFI